MSIRSLVLSALLVSACQDSSSGGVLDSLGPRRGSTGGAAGGGADGGGANGDNGLPGLDAGAGAIAMDAEGGRNDGGAVTDNGLDVPSPLDVADAPRDVVTCPGGTVDLSSVGAGNFSVTFHIVTKQTPWVALLNQRDACTFSTFWDIRQSAAGTIFVEIDAGSEASYEKLESTRAINDGNPHDVAVARVAGMLTIRIDGVPAGQVASSSSLGVLSPLRVGNDVCVGASDPPTVPFTGMTLSGVCIKQG